MDMKKGFIIPLFISIVLGFVSAQIIYSEYKKKDEEVKYNTYILQSGVYTSTERMDEDLVNLDKYLVVNENDKYYVYLAMTTEEVIANRLKNIYEEKGIDIYIKKVNINNIEFVSNLEQYDILLSGSTDNDSLMAINEVVLSSYEDLVISK